MKLRPARTAAACFLVATRLSGSPASSGASTRAAFEAAFPKTDASALALELESLAVALGFDLAPKGERNRSHPTGEAQENATRVAGPLSEYLNRELSVPDERIGAPSSLLRQFFENHGHEIAQIVAHLRRDGDLAWEVDVENARAAPIPNLLAHMRLQRVLVAKAFLDARRGEPDEALGALETSWRLNQSLVSRPELISHLIALAVAKLQVGALRKIDVISLEWERRMRSPRMFEAFLDSIQNEIWFVESQRRDLVGTGGAYGRALRRYIESALELSPCVWTPRALHDLWNDAFEFEKPDDVEKVLGEIGTASRVEALTRWPHALVQMDLTALVLEARAERAASRRRIWPAKLRNLESAFCPGLRFSYRSAPNGQATVAFDGKLPEFESAALKLPLAFTAGLPAPVPTPTRRASLTRTPAGRTLPGR